MRALAFVSNIASNWIQHYFGEKLRSNLFLLFCWCCYNSTPDFCIFLLLLFIRSPFWRFSSANCVTCAHTEQMPCCIVYVNTRYVYKWQNDKLRWCSVFFRLACNLYAITNGRFRLYICEMNNIGMAIIQRCSQSILYDSTEKNKNIKIHRMRAPII